MPTNYTPDPTATQAPAAAPDPDDFPLEVLPNSGEGCTAASIAQAFKVLGDYVAWLKKPRAAASAWAQPVRTYRNALLQPRGIVDHIGYNIGQVVEVDEDWLDVGKVLKNALANGAWAGRWNYSISGAAAGRVEVVGPGDNSFISGFYYPRTTSLKLSTGTGGVTANSASVEMPFAPTILDDDGDFVMQWPFMLGGSTGGNAINMAMGLTAITQQAVTTEFVAQDVQAVALTCRLGHANFELYSKGGVGVSHVDDTTIAKDDNPHRARLEIRGANANDDSTARVLFFLDGVLRVNRAISIGPPAGGITTQLLPFFKVTQTNVADHLWVGRLQMRANTETGNAVI